MQDDPVALIGEKLANHQTKPVGEPVMKTRAMAMT